MLQGTSRRILGGEYAPGSKLPTEPQLQAEWGVSRAVVREAMKILESQGLVRIEHGRGTFVTESNTEPLRRQIEWTLLRSAGGSGGTEGAEEGGPDLWDHLLDIRHALEVSGAERAALHANAEDIGEMQSSIDDIRAAPEDVATCSQADLRFHRALAGATRNPLWPALLSSMHDLLYQYLQMSQLGPENAMRTADQHERVLAAIRAGDAAAAAAAMNEHLETSRQDLLALREK